MRLRSSIGFTLVVLLFRFTTALAQDYQEKIFTVRDGLPADNVQSLFQDHRGFIWMTTDNGLARFDGYTFKVFHHEAKDSNSLSDSRTTALAEDRLGRIWVGTYFGGVNCYDLSSQKFTRYTFPPSKINHINLQQVNCLLVDSSGRLWSGNYNGLYYFDPQANLFTEFPLDSCLAVKNYYNWVINLETDGRHCLYVVTNHGSAVIDLRTMQSYYAKKNPLQLQILKDVSDANFAHKKNAIIYWRENSVLKRGELCEFNFENNSSRVIATANVGFPHSEYGLEDLDEGHLLATGSGRPIFVVDLAHGTVRPTSFNKVSSTKELWVTNQSGGEKNIWCATSGGLYLFSKRSEAFQVTDTRTLDKAYSRFNAVDQLLFTREKQFWLASYFAGVAIADSGLKPEKLFYSKEYDPRIYNFIWRLYEDREGKIWIGRQCGYSIYDPSTKLMKDFFLERHDNTGNNYYVSSSFLQTNDSTIWMGSNKGLAEVNEKNGVVRKWYIYDTNHPENFPLHRINQVVMDSAGNDWLLSDDGLFSFDPVSSTFKTFEHTIGSGMKLPSSKVLDVVSLSNKLLIGTTNGFCVLDWRSKELKTYTFSDGLPDEEVDNIVPENENVCWLVTRSGLSRFDLSNKSFTNFNYKDGLPSFEGEFSNLLKLPNGEFMITVDSFLVRFNPSHLNAATKDPPVSITEFVADGKSLPLPGNSTATINLSWKNRSITIDFSTLQFSDANLARYQYRLEGVDENWNNAFSQNRINYSDLPAGNYLLQVRAGYGNGVWGKPALLNFEIASPFWQAWWFWLLIGLVVISIPALLMWNVISNQHAKIKQQLKVNEERQRISSELHDDMGSTLTKIAMLGRALQLDLDDNKELLPRVTSSADQAVNQMNEIVWALNIRNDTLQNLLGYIRKYASEFLEEGKYNLQFEEPDHIPDLPLSGEVRRNIFLVVKEALRNIARHSGGKQVTIKITLDSALVISIADDGKGVVANNGNAFGNGMINMKQRMEQIHGMLRVVSPIENGQGTRIDVSFPIDARNMQAGKINK